MLYFLAFCIVRLHMAETLASPMSFRNGSAVSYTDSDDRYYVQIVMNLFRIEGGELPLTPDIGTPDPTFSGISIRSMRDIANKYVPEINITGSSYEKNDDGEVRVDFTYYRTD